MCMIVELRTDRKNWDENWDKKGWDMLNQMLLMEFKFLNSNGHELIDLAN